MKICEYFLKTAQKKNELWVDFGVKSGSPTWRFDPSVRETILARRHADTFAECD
jgi:hypothetical protein